MAIFELKETGHEPRRGENTCARAMARMDIK